MPEKERVVALVDGFNLYHAILKHQDPKLKWLSLHTLVKMHLLKQTQELAEVYYFTAFAHWNPDKVKRHSTYISALENEGAKIVLGEFKLKTERCRAVCKKEYKHHEEKMTDVNIALHLLKLAVLDRFDTAFLVTGDNDLVPAIKTVMDMYPHKKITVLLPPFAQAMSLINQKDHANFNHMTIKRKALEDSQLPAKITLEGAIVHRPVLWS